MRTAVAGGVNVMIAPNMTIAESKGGFLSTDGRCKAFDASANGYARGEGAGVVVLKPLTDALSDHDPIYAVIRGTAVTQDGHTNGITVPNGSAQEAAMQRAGLRPGRCVAARGPVRRGARDGHPGRRPDRGDRDRPGALRRPAGESRMLIGSVKTNIGHLEAAAGVAGLIKAALSLKHGKIPGQLHFAEPNPAIPFDQLKLRVPRELGDWPTSGQRYAGVNSFGFGGTNAHAVLPEPPTRPAPRAAPRRRPRSRHPAVCPLTRGAARHRRAGVRLPGHLPAQPG